MNKIGVIAVSVCLVWSCTGKSAQDGLSREDQVKKEQYIVEGQKLYTRYCSACHQKDGTGLGELYPPLSKSDYVEKNVEEVICIMKNGISGPIEVNGITYDQPMPGVVGITSLEVAEIATYIYSAWGSEGELISIKRVEEALKECDSNPG